MHSVIPSSRRGFTLIELAMVVALLAILSTLVISKFGGIRDTSVRQVSAVNQQGVSEAVGTFLAFNNGRGINYLDALIPCGAGSVAEATFDYSDAKLYAGPTTPTEKCRGLSDGLRDALCVYGLTKAEAAALKRDLGLEFVLRHAVKTSDLSDEGADGSLPPSFADILDPASSACHVERLTNAFAVAAVDARFETGALIYRAMGQNLPLEKRGGDQNIADADVPKAVEAAGGKLVAFGLGPNATVIGSSRGGMESCPYSEALGPETYRNYVLLVRLVQTSPTTSRAEFAGAIGPDGQAMEGARRALR